MELTQEDKARVFALYLGSEAECKNHFVPNAHSRNTDGKLIMSPSILADCHERTFYYGDFKLKLYDLSEITDEDAIEVAKILDNWLINHEKYNFYRDDSVIRIGNEGRYVKIHFNTGHIFCSDNDNVISAEAIDYLRFKSYMLPYKGINLFTAGIAIRKTR